MEELNEAEHQRRKLERKWHRSKLTIDHGIYRNHCDNMNKLLRQARSNNYTENLSSGQQDPKTI
jgi:hypothetical protein